MSSALDTSTASNSNKSACAIPLSRIKTIMKSSPEITHINQDTLQCVAKATVRRLPYLSGRSARHRAAFVYSKELFIQTLTKESYKKPMANKELNYENLASLVSKDDRFQFLSGRCPGPSLTPLYFAIREKTWNNRIGVESTLPFYFFLPFELRERFVSVLSLFFLCLSLLVYQLC
jgi:chromatin accessibility complex protein 1